MYLFNSLQVTEATLILYRKNVVLVLYASAVKCLQRKQIFHLFRESLKQLIACTLVSELRVIKSTLRKVVGAYQEYKNEL